MLIHLRGRRALLASTFSRLSVGGNGILRSRASAKHHFSMLGSNDAKINRPFSTRNVDQRKDIWNAYLVGSISADNLFSEIDCKNEGTINVEDIKDFLDSADQACVREESFDILQKLGRDHPLDQEEFNRWLCMAVKLRALNPMLEGILDGVKDEEDYDEYKGEKTPATTTQMPRQGLNMLVWELFLSTGAHGQDLFKMIDINRDGKVAVVETLRFIDSVEAKGVDMRKYASLKAKGDGHMMREKEFLAWLTLATGVQAEGEIGGGPVEDAGGEHSYW